MESFTNVSDQACITVACGRRHLKSHRLAGGTALFVIASVENAIQPVFGRGSAWARMLAESVAFFTMRAQRLYISTPEDRRSRIAFRGFQPK